MTEDERERAEWGDFLGFLCWLTGVRSQTEFAKRTGIERSEANRHWNGRQKPQPATFQRITDGLGIPRRIIPFLRWSHRLIRRVFSWLPKIELPPSPPREELHAAVRDAVGRALELAQADLALLRSRPPEKNEQRLKSLAQTLLNSSEARLQLLINGARSYRDPQLCLHLCRASEKAAADNLEEALKKAELALSLAEHVEGSAAFRVRLKGWCTGAVANVQRAIGKDLPSAERIFARAWRLWRAGEDPAGLLSEAYLLDMEASLRRDQGLFSQALQLHTDSLALARPEEVGVILLNQAFTLKENGDAEGALQSLKQASKVVDAERQPRLRCVLQFNQASSLLFLGRIQEAVPIVKEVRTLADRLKNKIDLIKTLWLEANCAAVLGQRDKALVALEHVRSDFEEQGLPYDYALASLDLALLYREEGRFAEIQLLAGEILEIFKAQEVHREAIAAVILFQEAAENERITVDLVRRLKDYLSQGSRPKGRFEA